MSEHNLQTWGLWIPKTAAVGVSFGRSQIEAQEVVLVHAAPSLLTVEVFNQEGQRIAQGKDLPATADTPMARLTRRGSRIEREDIWPEQTDLGRIVLLPGGEAGALLQWYNAPDHSEWRWQVEFYNRT
jgi:hypothetical protein